MRPIACSCLVAMLAALSVAGCGAMAPANGEDASSGWIVEFYRADELRPGSLGCAERIDLAGYAGGRYAKIAEPHGRRVKYVVAHLGAQVDAKVGDEVEIAPGRCTNGRLPEIRKVID